MESCFPVCCLHPFRDRSRTTGLFSLVDRDHLDLSTLNLASDSLNECSVRVAQASQWNFSVVPLVFNNRTESSWISASVASISKFPVLSRHTRVLFSLNRSANGSSDFSLAFSSFFEAGLPNGSSPDLSSALGFSPDVGLGVPNRSSIELVLSAGLSLDLSAGFSVLLPVPNRSSIGAGAGVEGVPKRSSPAAGVGAGVAGVPNRSSAAGVVAGAGVGVDGVPNKSSVAAGGVGADSAGVDGAPNRSSAAGLVSVGVEGVPNRSSAAGVGSWLLVWELTVCQTDHQQQVWLALASQ